MLYAAGTRAAGGGAGGDRAGARAAAAGAARARRRRPRARRGARRRCASSRRRSRRLPVLVLATGQEAAALARLEPHEALVLEPLDADGVGAIAGLLRPGRRRRRGARRDAAGHEPRRRRAASTRRRASGRGARRRAASTRRPAARRPAAAEARALEAELAGSVVELQSARERAGLVGADGDDADAPVVCPYKGLATFDADGRRVLLRARAARRRAGRAPGRRAAARGRRPVGQRQVVGARAGLLPALAGGVLPGSDDWTQALIRPGEQPLRELGRATRRLARERRGVLAVDQFEELFTACQDEAERAEFVAALVRAARDPTAQRRGARRARRLLRPLRRLPRAVAPARRQPRARRADVARRAAARDRAPGAAGRPERRAGAASTRCWPTSRASRARCRCCPRRCSSSGAGATGAACGSPRTRAAAASRAPSRGWPRTRSSSSIPASRRTARTLLLRLADEDEGGAIVRRRIALAELERRATSPRSSPGSPIAAC